MALNNPQLPDAPIPGENFTADERNYPWHRPPDIVNTDEAIDYVATHLSESDEGLAYMNMLESGVTIAGVTDMIITLGISDGKWTPDFGILIAGPVARLLTIVAKGYSIDYEMGLETDQRFVTSEFVKELAAQSGAVTVAIDEELQDVKDTAPQEEEPMEQGLMAMAPAEEQASMLGYSPEDDTNDEETVDV